MREAGGFRQQQQSRRLDAVAGDADQPRLLALLVALRVAVDDRVDTAVRAMLDPHGVAAQPQVEVAGRLGARDLRIQRAPLGAGLAPLDAEALLDAHAALVRRPRVHGEVSRVHAAVSDPPRAVIHDLEVARRRQARIALPAGHEQPPLGEFVVALELAVVDRPVDQRRAGEGAVGGARAHLPRLNSRRGAGPVYRRSAERLRGPRRQPRVVLGHRPASRRGARIEPSQLYEGFAGVLREGRGGLARSGLEQHDLDAAAREFVGQRAAAGAGSDDHHGARVVLSNLGHALLFGPLFSSGTSGSQSSSSKPRVR